MLAATACAAGAEDGVEDGGKEVLTSLTIMVPTSSTSCPMYGSEVASPGESFSGDDRLDPSPSTGHARGGEPLKEKSPDSATDMVEDKGYTADNLFLGDQLTLYLT